MAGGGKMTIQSIAEIGTVVSIVMLVMMTMAGCQKSDGDKPAQTGGVGAGEPSSQSAKPQTVDVVLGGRTFHLELALDDAARVQGLSDRKEIAGDGGMLFAFSEPHRLAFVMRKCFVPIDIIFLDAGGRVVQMHAMSVEPYDTPEWRLTRYDSRYAAQFAIELRGGTLPKLGLNKGDKIELPLEMLKQRAE